VNDELRSIRRWHFAFVVAAALTVTGSGDLLVLPLGETDTGARFAGALLDSSLVERRRFLGVNWYP